MKKNSSTISFDHLVIICHSFSPYRYANRFFLCLSPIQVRTFFFYPPFHCDCIPLLFDMVVCSPFFNLPRLLLLDRVSVQYLLGSGTLWTSTPSKTQLTFFFFSPDLFFSPETTFRFPFSGAFYNCAHPF